ncbi:2-keto-3-deoxy-phosphogluconate aldolase [Cryobacterium psychrotolerans]|uniref:2-keto-3-deoxy-phosphogluconate aldolase n=1 Tax=Cryobacterium psychrotolerans TaxID=386301 RepID=A0A1G9ETD4_9MICO|nr:MULTISPECIES: bifunctional 4-hydroxy-2-oxoglutarate aldolase/2-dehydro-3-deoxy-phosphogluconate aldolase [Cryobacterium]TFD41968.1 bifunctional 4-hydroxy-2-oxoglutarate aldolase/2-dehydro-3-deoxy-phosphogluconate aldolase [Cryobacterium sp. TMT1-2-1]TFD83626.1 bifunctional 4-hydroxy-2-oxoglutarate aldolase/2-dehydro-3-deoxy-phosphogluconate aldolase [Cryobacterium psychrotolerans]SDK79364.1 2-keto-3-deoxy-phosphogluconate aldolase [Cryobacterium psychrotolerans]
MTLAPLINARVLAVVRAPSAESALLAADALVAGGIFGLEITYSTPDAPAVIRELDARYGERIYLGAGTVTTPEEASMAAAAGARFLVSPGTRPGLTAAMKATGLVVLTGALTPSEVMAAIEYGADVVKIFPASLGGPAFLKALRGPFPDVALMPTGGVTPENLDAWFAAGAVAVGAGGDLVSGADLASGRYDEVERKARLFASAGARG